MKLVGNYSRSGKNENFETEITLTIRENYKHLIQDLDKNELYSIVISKAKEMAEEGMQVIALASKKENNKVLVLNEKEENDMTFIGFVAFLDSPKKDVKNVIEKLNKYNVKVKIL